MKISDHLKKIAAFEYSLAKFDPLADGELFIVFLMRAGTNRLNAALHALGATTDGTATVERLGDLNHTYKPDLASPPPEELEGAFTQLAFIEDLRPDFVRGARALDAQTAFKVKAAYDVIRHDTDLIIGDHK